MPTITLTPTACTESAGWKTLYYYLASNSSYYPRRINFTYPVSETLAGAGVNITRVTLHGYARNSNSAVKRLRWGFKPAADSGPGTWSALDGSSVLSGTFEAVQASSSGSYVYNRFSRSYPGDSVLARHIKAMFDAGSPVYLGVIQPDNSKSVSLNTALGEWTIDVEYELLGNVPTTSAHTAVLGATAITTTITKVIEGSTTTLRYRLGDTVVSTAELGTGTTHTYTPPASLGAHFPSEMAGTLAIDAETSLGGVSYGTVSASVALTLPEDAAPGGSAAVTRVWAEGVPSAARLDAFVQTQSGAQFAIAGTGKYGASIAAVSLTVEGKTYSGAAVTHASLASSGDVGYAYTVTDSRGLSSSFTGVIPVLAWSPPKIQSFLILRVTEDGTEAIDGTYAKGSVTASVSSLIVGGAEKNALSFRIRYREIAEDGSAEKDWTDCDSVTGSALSGTFTGLLMQGGAYVGGGGVDSSGNSLPFNDMLGYEFQLVVSDSFTSSVAADAMPTKVQHWDIDEASGNMGFGGDAPGAAEAAGYRFHKAADFPAGIEGVTNYAAAETPTGGTWIDGKRVYRTVLASTEVTYTGPAATYTLGTVPGIDMVVSISGAVLLQNTWCPVSYSHEDTAWNMAVYIDQATGNVNLTKGTKGTITAYAVIIEYTKTS